MYGGQCFGPYTYSLMGLSALAMQRGIPIEYYPLFNESHIDRGRNLCANRFLGTRHTHILFIDADIQFEPQHALDLLQLADPESDRDIVCGFYPKKCINWRKIVEAVKLGLADEDPRVLEMFVGDMAYTPELTEEMRKPRSIYDLTPLHEAATGFMMIQRRVFERLMDANPDLWHWKLGDKKEKQWVFFDAKIDPDENPYRRYLSEDYDFSRLVRNAGMRMWLAPWMNLIHHGYYQFHGSVEALAAVQRREAA
jgi:hypothetical protein